MSVHVTSLICIVSAFIYDAVAKMWEVNKSNARLANCLFQMKAVCKTENFLQHETHRFADFSDIPLTNLIAHALISSENKDLSMGSKSVDINPAAFLKQVWETVLSRTEPSITTHSSSTSHEIKEAVSLCVYKNCSLFAKQLISPS